MVSTFAKILVLALLCVAAAQELTFNTVSSFKNSRRSSLAETCYGLMIDAGSSGSRIYVYSWPCRTVTTIPEVDISQATPNTRNSKPLASYYTNPTGVSAGLSDLIAYADNLVPAAKKASTPLFLRATAGMRLISEADQEAILVEVRKYFRSTGYMFNDDSWARVITGQEEGALGWVAVNFLTKKLSPTTEPSSTDGAIDVGGASVQITFVPTTASQNQMTLKFAGLRDYTVYTYSFLGFGNDRARNDAIARSPVVDGVIQFPCFYVGYQKNETVNGVLTLVNGTGTPSECLALIKTGFNMTGCEGSNPCSINGVSLPALPSNMKFYGFSTIANTGDWLKISPTATPSQIITAASDVCSKTWSEVSALYPGNSFLWSNCFMALYAGELMQTAFKIGPNTAVDDTGKLSGISITWALGGILYDISSLPCKFDTPGCEVLPSPSPATPVISGDISAAVSINGFSFIAMIVILMVTLFVTRQ